MEYFADPGERYVKEGRVWLRETGQLICTSGGGSQQDIALWKANEKGCKAFVPHPPSSLIYQALQTFNYTSFHEFAHSHTASDSETNTTYLQIEQLCAIASALTYYTELPLAAQIGYQPMEIRNEFTVKLLQSTDANELLPDICRLIGEYHLLELPCEMPDIDVDDYASPVWLAEADDEEKTPQSN